MDIRFEISGDTLTGAINRALEAAADFTPVMAAIAEAMGGATQERFDKEQAPDGTPWTPSQRAIRDGGKTLQIRGVRGGLLGNLLGNAGYTSVEAWIGTNLVYAAIHHFGMDEARPVKGHQRTVKSLFGRPLGRDVTFDIPAHDRNVKMPARPIVGFSPWEQEKYPRMLADHLLSAWGGGA